MRQTFGSSFLGCVCNLGWFVCVHAVASLQTFMLLPLMWLPFAVYSNNEVAQLIDGLWWQHVNGDCHKAKQHTTRPTHFGEKDTARLCTCPLD